MCIRADSYIKEVRQKLKLLVLGSPLKIRNNYLTIDHCRWWLQPWNEKLLTPWKKSYDQRRQHIEKQRHYFANKCPSSQGYGFSSSHIWMWELDYKKSLALKNKYFLTLVLEKILESPLDCKEMNQYILKEISPEYSLEGQMLKLKLQYSGHLIRRTDSFEKTDSGKY